MRRELPRLGIATAAVGSAECRTRRAIPSATEKTRHQSVSLLARTSSLQICSHLGRAAVRIAFADGTAQIMLPFMLPWCSSELLLMAWSGCSRVAAMGAALIGSASLAHSSCMINMVSSWTRAYVGAEALQRVHVCVVVGRRDHEVSASW